MGYMHINNLYKDIRIMNFKECYALEKIHGTSAHIIWKDNVIRYSSGGMNHDLFLSIFNKEKLEENFLTKFTDVDMIVYGEAYGGKCQGMSETYGTEPKFIVFDVKIENNWLNVPDAEDVAHKLNLEFVDYKRINTNIEAIDAERDRPSTQAKRNGIEEPKEREGVVLRPIEEMFYKTGERVIVKHKGDKFRETKTPRKVDPEKLKLLTKARAIADEWVTPMRLSHVLDKLGNPDDMSKVRDVIRAMMEDVFREGEGEIVDNQAVRKAISTATAKLFKEKISKLR